MSDVVRDEIENLSQELGLTNFCKFISGRGSMFYIPKIKRAIKSYNYEGNYLVLIGKSLGGYYMAKIARWVETKFYSHYKNERLIIVDACWLGRHKNRLKPPITFQFIHNFFQLNETVLNGAPLDTTDLEPGQYKQMRLSYTDHWNIINHSEVRLAIRNSIKKVVL